MVIAITKRFSFLILSFGFVFCFLIQISRKICPSISQFSMQSGVPLSFLKFVIKGQLHWLMPVVPAAQEADTERIAVRGQPWQKG